MSVRVATSKALFPDPLIVDKRHVSVGKRIAASVIFIRQLLTKPGCCTLSPWGSWNGNEVCQKTDWHTDIVIVGVNRCTILRVIIYGGSLFEFS